jgi:hypothetical protein
VPELKDVNAMLTRSAAAAVIFALVVIGFGAGAGDGSADEQRRPSVSMEYDIDRPGADYSNFEVRDGNPEACRSRCAGEGRCQAFTFVKAGVQGRFARCYLKTTVPPRRADRCCISGVKQ